MSSRFQHLFLVCAVVGMIFGISQLAQAADAPSTPDTSSQENVKTESPSDDVTDRGISRFYSRTRKGVAAPPGTIAPPTAEPTGFMCRPNSGKCNCSGATDCKYMKDLIKDSCGKITCTGSGSSQTCKCTLNGM
ncbi:MAG: hypothetical protein E4H32_03495 [Nitrospirales bacterium]|nr:MAG: hypothetical protein E4H32_03495 [Nitrospirales bacterium]